MNDQRSRRSALSSHRASGRAWWETAITEVSDGLINVRGRPIQDLIGTTTFVQHVVFLFSGRELTRRAADLLEAVMIAGADHGPLAPSIAAARMAATCGVTFNSALATGINLLGDDHGGAAGDATRVLLRVERRSQAIGLDAAAREIVQSIRANGDKVAGFGHQVHRLDPRRAPVLALLESAVTDNVIDGRHLAVALAIEGAVAEAVGGRISLNIDGLWAIVCSELDLPPDFAMGAFCLSRSAGIIAHVHEEASTGVRIKGPCPPTSSLLSYVGKRPEDSG